MRRQQTIERPVTVKGFGLFGGADVCLELFPAPENHGIVFERCDLPNPVQIPALIDFVEPAPRRTVISRDGVRVEMIEHVMAALAGLRVDNCLVRLNAPEPPGGDGSSAAFVEAIGGAGIIEQSANRAICHVSETVLVDDGPMVGVAVQPPVIDEYEVGFILDYGASAIAPQAFATSITPQSFREQLAVCRTFVLETEVEALRSQGLGRRATTKNLLVFSETGVIDNEVHFPNECARHKVLDCVGDFALLGCDIAGRVTATRSGHRHNHACVRALADMMSRRTGHVLSLPTNSPLNTSPAHPVSDPLRSTKRAG